MRPDDPVLPLLHLSARRPRSGRGRRLYASALGIEHVIVVPDDHGPALVVVAALPLDPRVARARLEGPHPLPWVERLDVRAGSVRARLVGAPPGAVETLLERLLLGEVGAAA